ncbi:MAG: uncharacterized protein A8A55_2833 [Amphiamblys sp. WSBS2006]|nr:MAG: uncharacterized protein A8A55_2833 [Amphiamblys sp. WSBS2006]
MSKTNAIWGTLFLSVFFSCVFGVSEEREGNVSEEEQISPKERPKNQRGDSKQEPGFLRRRSSLSQESASEEEDRGVFTKEQEKILNEVIEEWENRDDGEEGPEVDGYEETLLKHGEMLEEIRHGIEEDKIRYNRDLEDIKNRYEIENIEYK